MENHTSEKERKYNEVCGLAYVNLFTLSKNHDCILFDEIDLKNEEHLFLLHVALGLSDIVEKKVVINASRATVRRLNKKLHIKDKSARIRCAKNEIEKIIRVIAINDKLALSASTSPIIGILNVNGASSLSNK